MASAGQSQTQALSVALGSYPHTRLLREKLGGDPRFQFVDVSPITKAFAQMVREGTYDISEMALITFLQAKAYGKPLVMLPVAVAARAQEDRLLCRADDTSIRGPADLVGKRVGVRAYSQTTGAWLRGILEEDFGVKPEAVKWMTFENPHVAEYSDPPFATRARPGQELLAMLRAGELDAVIVGNEKPEGFRDVYPDAKEAGESFRRKHGFSPVNHVIVVRKPVIETRLDDVTAFFDTIKSVWAASPDSARLPIGRPAFEPVVALALKYISAQGMLPRPLTQHDVWDGLPAALS